MQAIADLKALLLEILESAFQNGDVHATQQMGVNMMKARYLEYVISRFKTKTAAAKWLGVGSTYLCKLSKTAMNN